MSFTREEEYKQTWLNSFANNLELARELNDSYAHDIIESLQEKDFDTLEAALEDYRLRIGVEKIAMNEIRDIVTAKLKTTSDGESCSVENEKEEESEIPGNKVGVAGNRLIKESPTTAGVLPEGLQKYLDKKNGKKPKEETEEGKDKKNEKEATSNSPIKVANIKETPEEKKTREAEEAATKKEKEETKEASVKVNKKAAFDEKVKAWFQGSKEKTVEGPITSNDPGKLGYPKEVEYKKEEMAVNAPGGKDSRPWEQQWFEGAAAETKKVMGPKGEEFKEKVKQQRIPEGEKEANANAKKWLETFRKSGHINAVSKINSITWKTALNKKASAPPGFDPKLEEKIKKEYPGEPEKAYATMWAIHNKEKK